ncbi:MAG: 3'-5' exonuclease [Litorivicinaceae bacterium]
MPLAQLARLAGRFKHRNSPYRELFMPYRGDEVVSLDCETSGLDPKTDALVSIGAVIVKGRSVLTGSQLHVMIDHGAHLSAESIRIHRIRKIDLAAAQSLETALGQLLAFIGNRPLLGYNLAFDVKFLNRAIEANYGFRLPNRQIDLADVYRRHIVKRQPDAVPHLGFDEILAELNLPVFGRHTAIGDAITVAMAYVKLTTSR